MSDKFLAGSWDSSTQIPLRSASSNRKDILEKSPIKKPVKTYGYKPIEKPLSPVKWHLLADIDPIKESEEKFSDIKTKDLQVKLSGIYAASSRLAQPTISSSKKRNMLKL